MICVPCDGIKEFIGGSNKTLTFDLYDKQSGRPFNLSVYAGKFTLSSAINPEMSSVVSKAMDVQVGSDGETKNRISVSLEAADTIGLSGKFNYQIMIYTPTGQGTVPLQSSIIIHRNNAQDIKSEWFGDIV